MTLEDLAALRNAAQSLEHPRLAARLTNIVGRPIELIGQAYSKRTYAQLLSKSWWVAPEFCQDAHNPVNDGLRAHRP